MTLAGFPTAMDSSGISRVTTLPAPFSLAFLIFFNVQLCSLFRFLRRPFAVSIVFVNSQTLPLYGHRLLVITYTHVRAPIVIGSALSSLLSRSDFSTE